MSTTQLDERDLIEVLRFELEFVEKGGYHASPREPRKASFFFEDSPTCMNYDSKMNPAPCTECVLIGLVPPEQRNRAIPCRHIPLDAAGNTLDSLYRQAECTDIEETYEKWLRSTIAKLVEQRESRSGGAQASAPEAPGTENKACPGEPLFGKLHPKCANPSCSAAFHWLAGGRFYRFRPGELAHPTKAEVADGPAPYAAVKHYWLCETCVRAYTLNYYEDTGVVVEFRWPELPFTAPTKQLSAARR